MIEFSCIYCGQPVRVDEKLAHKRIACPGCGHSLLVRARRPGAALERTSGARDRHTAEGAADWNSRGDQEIIATLLAEPPSEQEQRRRATKVVLTPFLPRYDDLTLFALSLAFALLLLVNPDLHRDLSLAYSFAYVAGNPLWLIPAGAGMLLALVNVFCRHEKSDVERCAMLAFAVLVTAGTGLYAGARTWRESRGWLLLFPAWNLFNGALLLLLFRARLIDTDCIVDRRATFAQILVTVVAVSSLIAVCDALLCLHWVVTFSVAVAYTMSLHHSLRRLFGQGW